MGLANPIPIDDDFRVKTLHLLKCLDTPNDARLDLITQFAASEFDVPICLIALIDKHRQWCKSVHGDIEKEIPRNISFCTHAIYQISSNYPFDRVFEVTNADQDDRFVNNPLVTGDPYIKSYIAFVLQSKTGMNLGTLCLIDNKPRKYSGEEIFSLVTIGRIAEDIINHVC